MLFKSFNWLFLYFSALEKCWAFLCEWVYPDTRSQISSGGTKDDWYAGSPSYLIYYVLYDLFFFFFISCNAFELFNSKMYTLPRLFLLQWRKTKSKKQKNHSENIIFYYENTTVYSSPPSKRKKKKKFSFSRGAASNMQIFCLDSDS